MKDFFISYNRADRQWAEWIAWQLEEAGYTVIVQAWDIRPRSNFILEMHKAARETERTIAVLSPAYLSALYTQPELAAALVKDPTSEKKKLLLVRVQDCTPDGLLSAVVYIDLVGKNETDTKEILLAGVEQERVKPSQPPTFPRLIPEQARFPTVLQEDEDKKAKARVSWLPKSDKNLERRNRHAMLDKVRQYWITGVLQQSLYNEVMITLGLTERSTAVVRPLDVLVQRPDRTERPLPADTKIGEVFEELRGSLLILGAPGSGKTTLLLELTRDLLDHAEQDSGLPIPVVFPLSTWGEQQLPLAQWLIDELTKRYDVPQKVAQTWIEHDHVLPLLDGLDEVKEEYRVACVEAINEFRKEHGFLLPLAVCCRIADYEAIGKQLRLQGSILVQPLTRQQVETYLDQLGDSGEVIRSALREDSTLWELAETPLLLNIMTLAYEKKSDDLPYAGNTSEARRQRLFTSYINRMFQHRSDTSRYTTKQTLRWLSWLAQQMNKHALTVFSIERVHPHWFSHRQTHMLKCGCLLLVLLLFQFSFGLLDGLLFGLRNGLPTGVAYGLLTGLPVGLLTGLLDGLLIGLRDGLLIGLLGGLLIGLLTGLFIGLSAETRREFLRFRGRKPEAILEEIQIIETVRWSWSQFFSYFRRTFFYCLIVGLLVGLIVGLLAGLIGELRAGLAVGLRDGLIVGLLAGLIGGLISGIHAGLVGHEIKRSVTPTQGIRQSARNALIYGLLTGILVGLFGGLLPGLLVGLLVGLKVGGLACLQYFCVRLVLTSTGSAPWNYPAFLDYAAERVFLRKVGGGYMFIHRMLLEHFASLEAKEVTSATKTVESTV